MCRSFQGSHPAILQPCQHAGATIAGEGFRQGGTLSSRPSALGRPTLTCRGLALNATGLVAMSLLPCGGRCTGFCREETSTNGAKRQIVPQPHRSIPSYAKQMAANEVCRRLDCPGNERMRAQRWDRSSFRTSNRRLTVLHCAHGTNSKVLPIECERQKEMCPSACRWRWNRAD